MSMTDLALWSVWLLPLAMVLWMRHKLRADRREHAEAVMAELQANGEFRRHWVSRRPDDLRMDRVDLECGHWTYCFSSDEQLEPGQMLECGDCARQYLKDAQKGRK